MASTMPAIRPANGARIRLLTFPREHGAWGILLVPLGTGAAIGLQPSSRIFPLFLFVIAALALFCLRTPVESLLAASPLHPQTPAERHAVVRALFAYSLAAVATLVLLIGKERAYGLLILGGAAAGIFFVQAVLKKLGRETRMSAQLIGALGLTSTAAAAYYVVTGRLDATGLVLWAANWLFVANQIHYVQVRIHSARSSSRMEKFSHARNFLAGEILVLILLGSGWWMGLVSVWAVLAFVPILLRGFFWLLDSRPVPLEVRRLGLTELTHAVVFGVLFVVGFHLGGT